MLEDSDRRSLFNYTVSSGYLDTLAFMLRAYERVLSLVWSSLNHFSKSPLYHHVASNICSIQVVNFLI